MAKQRGKDSHVHEYVEALVDVALKLLRDPPPKGARGMKRRLKDDITRTQASLLRVKALVDEIPGRADVKQRA